MTSQLRKLWIIIKWTKTWFIWHLQDQRSEGLQFTSYYSIIPNVYDSVPSNCLNTHNHLICHMQSCPIFPTMLSIPCLVTPDITWCIYTLKKKTRNQVTHFAVAILIAYVNLPCHKSFLISFYFVNFQNQCWVLLVGGTVKCIGPLHISR